MPKNGSTDDRVDELDEYCFSHLEFYWGESDKKGSEHSFDYKRCTYFYCCCFLALAIVFSRTYLVWARYILFRTEMCFLNTCVSNLMYKSRSISNVPKWFWKYQSVVQISRRRWTTGLTLSVSYSVHEDKRFFATAVCASVLKLIYHEADLIVHLFLLISTPWPKPQTVEGCELETLQTIQWSTLV